MVLNIEVAENQLAALILDAVLIQFEDRILEILTTHFDSIIIALDVYLTHLDAQ